MTNTVILGLRLAAVAIPLVLSGCGMLGSGSPTNGGVTQSTGVGASGAGSAAGANGGTGGGAAGGEGGGASK
jgi:hypothetical protein